MKNIITISFLFICLQTIAQTYNPLNGTVSNKPYSPAQNIPTDGRSWLYDSTNFIWRPYQSVAEANTKVTLPKYRGGNYSVFINFGGILNSNGTFTGGIIYEYWWRNGVADSNLVRKYNDQVILTPEVDTVYRKNDSTVGFTINHGPERTFLIRGTAAGGINSLVLNAPATLFGTPINFTSSGGAWSGSLVINNQNPNYFFAGPSSGGPGAPLWRQLSISDLPTGIPNGNLQNTSITFLTGSTGTNINWSLSSVPLGGTLQLNIPDAGLSSRGLINPSTYGFFNNKVDSTSQSGDTVYDWRNGNKTFRYLLSAGSGITQLTGDGTAGPGSGSQVFTLATVNSNVGSFGDASHVSTFTVNGKGLLTTAGQTSIQISESQVTNLTSDLASKISLTSLSATFPLLYNNSTGVFSIQQANTSQSGYLSNTDWDTFNSKQGAITLTTTGTSGTATFGSGTLNIPQYQGQLTLTTTGSSGAATLVGNTLNIPQYSGGGGSGTVTSVAQTVPSSLLTITGSPITTNGTLAIGLTTATANSIWGNNTGSTATPAYFVPTSTTLNGWFGSTIQSAITLTTTGTSGAATFVGGTLNIPQYTSGSAIPPNIGLGFRVYSPQVPGFKTIFAGTNVTIDSTTNTNGLTISASGGGGLTPQANHTYLGVSNLTGSTAVPTAVTQPFYMATDYGIVGDSATDNTTAIQNLINFVPAGSVIFFPAGKYITTSKLTITKSITIQGTEGAIGNINTAAFPFACSFYHTTNSDTAFYISSTGVQFIGMALVYPGGTAATSASRGIYGDNFKNGGLTHMQIMGFNVNFEVKNGGEWRATQGCFFKNAVTYNMVIQNAGNHDDGDQLIDNCYFSSESANSAGSSHINYISGGGLRITNSKFNALSGSFAKDCIDVPFVGTVDFFVQNNSFENFTGRGISIIPTGSLTEMYITGNEFDEHQTASGAAFIYIDGSTGSASSYLAVINDNGFNGANTTDTAIYLNGITHASVGDGNVYRQIPNRLILGSTIGLSDVSATFNPLVQAPTNTTLKHTTDGQGGDVTNITITGTDTIAISNPVIGREMAFQITQDATGGRQAVLPANWANLPQNTPALSGSVRLNLDTRSGAQTLVTGYVNAARGFTITNVQRAYTNGSIAYYSNGFVEDNANLFYDATTHSLLLGTTTANAKSILTMNSTTQGFLPPRMTTTQINAITSQPEGLMYYDNVNHAYYYWNGTAVTPFASLSNPMTTQYDIIYGGVGGVPTRLGAGANGTFLGVSGGVLGYYTPSGSIGGLTTNQVVKATSATSIANSNISDDGTTIKIISGTSGVFASYFGLSGTLNRFRASVNQFNDSSGYSQFGSGSQVNSCILCTVGDVNINGALWVGSSSSTTGFKITYVGVTSFLDNKGTNGTTVIRSNANSVTNVTFNADGSSTFFTPTTTAPTLVLPAGTKPTSMSQGWLAAATGHLWYHDGSTDYDLLASGGGAVSSVSNSDGTLTISPTTGAVVASLALGHANTWSALQTFGSLTSTGTTKFTGLTSAGANDSVATIDPATGTMHWRAGSFNLTFNNGLTASGTTVSLGGALIQATTLATAGFNLNITGLPNKSTPLSTDSLIGQDNTGKTYKFAFPSGGGFSNPMTSVGDIIVGGTSGAATRLGIGTTGQVATVSGGTVTWGPVLTSGTYTPTLTNTANISSSSLNQAYYTRVGNIVHVTITGNITATASLTNSILTFTLPISSSITTGQGPNGQGIVSPNSGGVTYVGGLVQVLTGTTGQLFFYYTGPLSSSPFSLSFDYSL